MGKVYMSSSPDDFGGENAPHKLELKFWVAEISVWANAGKLCCSSQQAVLLPILTLRSPFGVLFTSKQEKEGNTTESSCVVFSAGFLRKGLHFGLKLISD